MGIPITMIDHAIGKLSDPTLDDDRNPFSASVGVEKAAG